MDTDNCLSYAFKIADKKYSALMGILPLVFIIIEMVKLNADIEGNPEDVRDGIRTARVVACIIAALLFLYTALGGLSVYIKSEAPFRDSRTVWWIASGVEGTLIFIVLAVFQYRDYNDGDPIQESPFFWVIMSLVVGMLTFFILKDTCKIFGKEKTDGKLIALPDDEKIVSLKLTAIIFFSVWLSYRPANPDFDTAGLIILIVTLVVALIYSLMIKNRKKAYVPILVWCVLPVIVIATSFYKQSGDVETLQYVYLAALIVALLVYLGILGGFLLKSSKEKENKYIEPV